MQVLHQEHVVYRDLNPSNILLDRGLYVKIVDFGLAKVLADLEPLGYVLVRQRPLQPTTGMNQRRRKSWQFYTAMHFWCEFCYALLSNSSAAAAGLDGPG